jgi:diguanylate cyclase (GGDEF)-like protein
MDDGIAPAVVTELARRGEVERLLAVIATQNELAAAELAMDDVLRVVVRRAAELTGADAGVVELPEDGEMVYRAVTGTAASHLGLRLDVTRSLSGRCLLEGRILRCDDAETDDRVDREAARRVGARSMLCVPLADRETTRGVLKVYAEQPDAFDDADVAILTQLSDVIVAHMRRAAEFERKDFESRHDSLTDLGNRRAYEERLATEVERAERRSTPLTLVLLDLDRFKQVNDTQGHPAGDEVLRRTGHALHALRERDGGFRIGGDEFALILHDSDLAVARRVADRVTVDIARRNAAHGVTATAGIAGYEGGGPQALHEAADARLVAAKAQRA